LEGVHQVKEHGSFQEELKLPIGFNTANDQAAFEIGEALRLLYLNDLKRVQTGINQTLSILQKHSSLIQLDLTKR
jgi:hypothetical protein